MINRELNIEWIEKYIEGDLNVDDMIWVEQQLSEHEQWRDVYEGLQFASQRNIDVSERITKLDQKLIRPLKSGKVIPIGYKRWMISVASIAGFLLLGYTAIKLINQNAFETSQVASNSDPLIVHTEDEIQIIAPTRRNQPKVQVFSAERIERIAMETEPVIEEDINHIDMVTEQPQLLDDNYIISRDSQGGLSAYAQDPNFSHSQEKIERYRTTYDSLKNEVDKYPELLARYGYKVIKNPDLTNTERGASAPSY